MKTTPHLCIVWLLLSVGCAGPTPDDEKSLPMKVAEAYGFDQMDQVESIQYTWNVRVDSVTVRSRSWEWGLSAHTVRYSDPDTTVTYSLSDKGNSPEDIDSRFVNDKYWLLFPFQLAWDTGYEFEVVADQTAPISGDHATKLTIVYNDTDGYTPGDAYDLYLSGENMIKEWVFRRGNGENGRAMTWENVRDFGGIKIAMDHKDENGNTVLWFTDVVVAEK